MDIFLGLIAAICWGASDFFARVVTHRIGTYKTLLFMQFAGLVGLGIYLIGTNEYLHLLRIRNWQSWVGFIAEITFNIISSLALYKAFKVGLLSVVSPIAASYAAFTVMLDAFSGESVSQTHYLGMGALLVGVLLTATPFTLSNTSGTLLDQKYKVATGVGYALLASLCYGIAFWLLGIYVIPVFGGVITVWMVRASTFCLLTILTPVVAQHLFIPKGDDLWYLMLVGILDTIAFVSYTFGIDFARNQTSIVNVLVSLFSTVTVLLALIFLREKLSKSQWVGILIIFVGIFLVNV